jgi:carbon monoxide dehydrogenase subunit G
MNAFVLAARCGGVPRIVRETTIHRLPAEVFDLLTDCALLAKILPGVASCAVETPGPLRVGSRIVERRADAIETEMTVTEHVLGRRLWRTIHADRRHTGESGFALAPVGGSTRLTYTVDFRLAGVMRLLTPMTTQALTRQAEDDLAAMKAYLDPKRK